MKKVSFKISFIKGNISDKALRDIIRGALSDGGVKTSFMPTARGLTVTAIKDTVPSYEQVISDSKKYINKTLVKNGLRPLPDLFDDTLNTIDEIFEARRIEKAGKKTEAKVKKVVKKIRSLNKRIGLINYPDREASAEERKRHRKNYGEA